jgi:NAD(P)H-hydrate epimerase
VLVGERAGVRGDARLHLEAFERSGGSVVEAPSPDAIRGLASRVAGADLVVDALLGTGLSRAPEGAVAAAIDAIRALAAMGVPVVAVDLPSGVPSDHGSLDWPAVEATVTVTFVAPKHGHVLAPASDHAGELVVADIGVPLSAIADAGQLALLEAADAAAAFPRRPRAAHKGTFGHVLIVGGCPGKTGATVLAARGAFAAGAGLVTIATIAETRPLVVSAAPAEVMTADIGAAFDESGAERALAVAESCTAVVLGPGLGDPAARPFARAIAEKCGRPTAIDAGAIAALAESRSPLPAGRPCVLTPHPGEMTALAGISRDEIQAARIETVRRVASATGAVVVLKGHRTLIADAGGRTAVNPTGNPGMAVAGTGDVLAGMIGALLARGLGAWEAATAGVYVHGAAGDEAARLLGEESMTASDLVAGIPPALRAIGAR